MKASMTRIQKLELTWIEKEQRPKLEPRILLEDSELSYHAAQRITDTDIFDNILINGDNLLALKALEQEFTGKVRCIYIDPPYNTGYAFEHYDDGIEHSLWLAMMRDRLELLRILLRDDGVIVVQIGFDEMAYLKVLMDEVFGRDNCIGQVAVRMSHSAGLKRQAKDRRLIKNTEYLLFYFNKVQPVLYPLYEKVNEFPVNYFHWIVDFPSEGRPGRYAGLAEELYRHFKHLFDAHQLKAGNNSIMTLYQREPEIQRFLIENRDRVARKHAEIPRLEQSFAHLQDDEFERVDTDSRFYYMGYGKKGALYQLIPLTEKVQPISCVDEEGNVQQTMAIANLLGDWWDGFWRDMSRVDVEGAVLMKESKKPERLLQWVLQLCTQPGDLILDSFLGSGTTAAVAQKMRRRWIGIELGDHCRELAHPRLKRVIDGEDHSGITAAMGWKGGGGFQFFRLAPSLLQRDKWGNWIINKDFNASMLAEAVCKLEGFTYAPSDAVYWQQGYSNERDFIYVTTQILGFEQLQQLSDEVGDERTLLVLCAAFRAEVEQFPNLTVKKIPRQVLTRCEWGHDDYRLQVAGLVEDATSLPPHEQTQPRELSLFD